MVSYPIFLFFLLSSVVVTLSTDPDVGLDMIAVCENKGYEVEEHFVTTTDGYILGVFRIPRGQHASPTEPIAGKPVVFLQHGLEDSSYTWVNNFPGESLGFILADAGYDVWFGNVRGNHFSKKHLSLKTNSKKFWDFSWDDMADKDLPASIDYVLEITGQAQLSYIGHSQGSIIAFAGFSENSTLASKINIQIMVGPVAYAHHLSSPLLKLMAELDIDKIVKFFGFKQFLPDDSILQKIDSEICKLVPYGCNDILFLITGYSENLNATRMDVYMSQTPADTSVKNMVHWGQLVRNQPFSKYDYGCGLLSCKNKKYYGQKTPPLYDLSKVSTPTALFWGSNDVLADPQDVDTLIQQLPSEKIVFKKYIENFAHLDFVWAPDAAQLVYPDILKLLSKYSTTYDVLSSNQQ